MKIITPLFLSTFLFFSFNTFSQTTPDPGVAGTHTVIKAEYNLGDLAYKPPTFPNYVEMRGSVHYPADLSSGPFPVLIFLHGRHSTCYLTASPGNTRLAWPCGSGYQSIVSYEGYDYLARTMASHGYIVISISCNAINAADNGTPDYGMQARAELIQHHLDLWNTYNTTGAAPFDTTFIGKLDMQNIGTMGHSRGGEGVVFNALYNKSLGSPYGIKAVLTLAPVDFKRRILNGTPLMNVAPYCDGDVYDLQGVHFYDDARYTDTADEAPKHNVVLMGANHNFFNTVWTPGSYIAGGSDDWFSGTDQQCGTIYASRFDTTTQKAALNAYAAAFFRTYIGHEKQFAPILEVNDIVPPASSMLDSSDVYVSYHPGRTKRLDINRIDTVKNDTVNTMTGAVTKYALVSSGICGGGLSMANCGLGIAEPHAGNFSVKGLAQMRLRWNDTTEWYQNELPIAYQDLTYYQSLIFRTSVNHNEMSPGPNVDFNVQLIDSAGNIASQPVSKYTHALYYEPGTTSARILFNTISLPLNSFSGINMAKVKYVKFLFNRSTAGSILISDLAFVSTPCGKLNAVFADSLTDHYKVLFTNNSLSNTGDSLTWKWKFGDFFSGANDSSKLSNPLHQYSGAGTYKTCLYVKSFRRDGTICADTFCTNIILTPNAVPIQTVEETTIVPNPAKDHLRITGVSGTATFVLVNLYGQTVLTAAINGPDIYLPENIVTGVYYAVVITSKGRVYKKLVINR